MQEIPNPRYSSSILYLLLLRSFVLKGQVRDLKVQIRLITQKKLLHYCKCTKMIEVSALLCTSRLCSVCPRIERPSGSANVGIAKCKGKFIDNSRFACGHGISASWCSVLFLFEKKVSPDKRTFSGKPHPGQAVVQSISDC